MLLQAFGGDLRALLTADLLSVLLCPVLQVSHFIKVGIGSSNLNNLFKSSDLLKCSLGHYRSERKFLF